MDGETILYVYHDNIGSIMEGAMEVVRGGHIEHGMLMRFTSSVGGAMIKINANGISGHVYVIYRNQSASRHKIAY